MLNLFRTRSSDKSTFQDINRVEASFSNWGQQFTYDCNKEERGFHDKWFVRNMKHVVRIAELTRSRLNCKKLNDESQT